MNTNKIIFITEHQFKALVELKKKEKTILTNIIEDIRKHNGTLNEASLIEEGIVDTLKNYASKGLMTTALIASLLASNNVNAQQLQAAGIPQEQIVQASNKSNSDIPLNKIENRLIHIMKQNNLKGSLDAYQKLDHQQKQNILQGIKSKIKSIDDVDKFDYASIGNWQKSQMTNPNAIQFDQKSQQVISVDTIISLVTVPLQQSFIMNSAELSNPKEVQDAIKEMLNAFTEVDSVIIESSSSTLRNRGDFENLTWQQSSQKRAEAIVNLINGLEHDLGGQGVNPKQTITPEMIKINASGQNGDGTSGPKSPYEVDSQATQSYQQRGIDSKFWQSAAKEAPLQNIEDYNQYQYVNISIKGRIVETDTQDIPSYRYIVLMVKENGGNIKLEQGTQKKQDYSKCPVKITTPKVKLPKGSMLQARK